MSWFDEVFEFVLGGSDPCEQCEALEGFHDEEPALPHPNCQCEVLAQTDPGQWQGAWWVDFPDFDPDDLSGGSVTVSSTVYIECVSWDGSTHVHSEVVTLTIDVGDLDFESPFDGYELSDPILEDDALDAFHDAAMELAHSECPPLVA